jgi:hypothetical protein
VDEIRRRLALDLEPHPVIDRLVGSQSKPKRRVDFMVVGGSNARRLYCTLNEAGHSAYLICKVGWTINRENCDSLASNISGTIKDEDPATVVLFLLDNSCFYTRCEDGGRMLPKKMADGIVHVPGEMVVASRDVQTEHFHALRPVLDAIGKRPVLIVSPLQRYIVGGCCQDVRHVANRLDRGFQEDQKQQLALLTRNLKAFLFNNRRWNIRVVDVAQDLIGFDNADMWCMDPVHPVDQVYRRIAGGVLKMAANYKEHEEKAGAKRRRPENSDGDEHMSRRPREYNYSRSGTSYDDRQEEDRGQNQRPREYNYSRRGRGGYGGGYGGNYGDGDRRENYQG